MNDVVWEPQQKVFFYPHPPPWDNHCIAYDHAHSHDLAAALTVAHCRMKGYLTRLSQLALLFVSPTRLTVCFIAVCTPHSTPSSTSGQPLYKYVHSTFAEELCYLTRTRTACRTCRNCEFKLQLKWHTEFWRLCQFCSRSWIFISHSKDSNCGLELLLINLTKHCYVYMYVYVYGTHTICGVWLHCTACMLKLFRLPFVLTLPVSLSLPHSLLVPLSLSGSLSFPFSLFSCLFAVGQSPCQQPKIILEYQISFASR